MARMRGKLSAGILNDINQEHQGTIKVVIHRSCPQCKWHLERRNITIEQELPLIGAYVVEVPRRAIPVLAEKHYIKYIEHDARVIMHLYQAQETIQSTAFRHMNACTGKGVTIACIDTGIFAHPDFTQPENRIAAFVDLISGKDEPYDDNGHGTFCMGCAGGNGTASDGEYAGIAPQASLIMLKALDRNGGGRISTILKAMQWVSDHAQEYNIRILSLSLGIEAQDLSPDQDTLADAAEALWSQGVVVVAAAGNSGPSTGTINSPGTASSVITVGAVDDREGSRDLRVASFSSRSILGGHKPDLLAPGVDIIGASPGNTKSGYTTMSGTSMATPIVAGCAALMIEKDPMITPDHLKEAMLAAALDIGQPESIQGRGVVQM